MTLKMGSRPPKPELFLRHMQVSFVEIHLLHVVQDRDAFTTSMDTVVQSCMGIPVLPDNDWPFRILLKSRLDLT